MSRMTLTRVVAIGAALVAVVALLGAALLTTPLVRTSSEDTARTALSRQAGLLARLPGERVASQLEERADTRPVRGGLAIGVVTAEGRTAGAALALPPEDLAAVRAGRRVSTTASWREEEVLIEARPLRGGGAVVLASSLRDVDAAVSAQRRRFLLALGLGLVVAIGVGAMIARSLGRPLAALADSARRLGGGERGVVPPVAGTREVADVAHALRSLDIALQQSEGRQRRFLMTVSHELRTPLTAVRGYAEALVDGAIDPAEMADVGRILVGESLRLEGFIEDLLALARLQADDFVVHADRTDLTDVVRSAVAGWQERARRADVRVEARTPDATVVVDTDAGRLRQALDALVDNAVRVGPPGTLVIVSLTADGGDVGGARLEVRDSGPGLAPADAADAFEPGVLHERYGGRRPGGRHGLGLAIVHRLVGRLGGNIHVEAAQEGGASFVIELPARTPD